jgi:hypothetical protein
MTEPDRRKGEGTGQGSAGGPPAGRLYAAVMENIFA